MLVYKRRQQPVLRKEKQRISIHQLLSYEQNINGWKSSGENTSTGQSVAAIDEPEWFNIMNPILSETHTELKVATKAADIESDGTCSSEDDEYSDN